MRPSKAAWQFPVCCLFHCLKEVIYTKIILYFLAFLVALWLGPLFMFPNPSINLDLWAEFPHFLQWSHKVKVRTFSPSNSSDFQFQAEKHDPLFYFKPLKSGKLSFMLLNLGSNNTAWGGWWSLFKELNLPQTPGYILLYLKRDRRGPLSGLPSHSLRDLHETPSSKELLPTPLRRPAQLYRESFSSLLQTISEVNIFSEDAAVVRPPPPLFSLVLWRYMFTPWNAIYW